jgi:DNA-directed RNA polymerase specialized sigma24 family protein
MLSSTDASTTDVAFQRLYKSEYPAVVRLARLLTGSASGAEDLAQDAFVRLYRQGDQAQNPPALLRTITVNLCRSWHRSRARSQLRLVRHGPTPAFTVRTRA